MQGCQFLLFQFEDGILNICLWLLKKCFNGKSYHNFSDPIRVARAISKMVSATLCWGNLLTINIFISD